LDWRPLLDDLAVTLGELPHGDLHWIEQALELSSLVDAFGAPPPGAADALAEAILDDDGQLAARVAAPALEAHDTGWGWANLPRAIELFRARSAIEGLRDVLAARPDAIAALDVARLDARLEDLAWSLARTWVWAIPAAVPRRHWWWWSPL